MGRQRSEILEQSFKIKTALDHTMYWETVA